MALMSNAWVDSYLEALVSAHGDSGGGGWGKTSILGLTTHPFCWPSRAHLHRAERQHLLFKPATAAAVCGPLDRVGAQSGGAERQKRPDRRGSGRSDCCKVLCPANPGYGRRWGVTD